MATLAFRAASTIADNFGGPSVNITAPAGTVQDDLGVIFYLSLTIDPSGVPTHTTPTGWTLAGTFTATNFVSADIRLSIFYRIEGASPQTETLTSSLTAAHIVTRVTYDNPNLLTPYDTITAANAQTYTGTTNAAVTGLTTAENNELLLMCAIQTSSTPTWTPDADFTERSDANGQQISEWLFATAGATGNQTAVASASGSGLVSLIAFRSETGGGGGGRTTKNTRAFPVGVEIGMNWRGSL
jgi:hypothetical protein